MSAAKHTPGKWVVKSWTEHDMHGAIESCGDQVVARLPNGDEVGIFTTALEGDSLADLQLISAAPDLLDALQQVTEILDMALACSMPLLPPNADGPAAMARAAIAKATGRTQ